MRKQDFIHLYLLCFTEDSYEDAETLWNMVPENRIMSLYEEGSRVPCSMLVLLDGTLINGKRKYPLYYVYAACTHPRYRNNGKMGQLLRLSYERAIKDGRHGLFLNPASETLVSYYAHEGFRTFSGIKTKTITASSYGRKPVKLSAEDGVALRQSILEKTFQSFIKWPFQVASQAILYADNSNGGAYTDSMENPKVFLLAEPRNNILVVREAIGKDADYYIPQLAASLGCSQAYVRHPGSISDKCFGMLKSDGIPIAEDSYMGIALD